MIKWRHLGIVVASLLWAMALAFDWFPWLRGGYGWQWMYEVPSAPLRLVPLALGLFLYLAVGGWLIRRPRAVALLAWAVAGSVLLTLAGLFVSSSPLFKLYAITASGGPGGWHYAAAHITDLGATLRDWPRFMQQAGEFSPHMTVSPPGPVVIYYAFDQILARFPAMADFLALPLRAAQCHNFRLMFYTNAQLASAWLGILMPVWGGLTVLPLYQLGRRLFDDKAARWSVFWWPLIPSFLMFAPTHNTFFPLIAVTSVLLLVEGLRHGLARVVLAAGGLVSLATFISFAFFPLIFLIGLFVLGLYAAKTGLFVFWPKVYPKWCWPFVIGLVFGLGLTVIWGIAYVVSGVSFVAVWQASMKAHLEFDRPYLPWVFFHLYDYLMFTGWPLAVLAGIGSWRALDKLRTSQPFSDGDVLTLATAFTLAVLDLSGTMRGESGRILLLLTPFFLLSAARTLNVETGIRSSSWIISIGQAAVLLVMVAFLRVMVSEFDQPPPVAPPIVQPSPQAGIPSGAVFDNTLRLRSFAGEIKRRPDAQSQMPPYLFLWLDWESMGQANSPYLLSLIPVAPNGEAALEATVVQPLGGHYPVTCWQPRNGPIRDYVQVPLFNLAEEGDWWISLAWVDDEGTKLPVVMPDGSRDDQAGLGPFHFKP